MRRGGGSTRRSKPKAKEVAGPYRSQSSNPKVRSKATKYEHRKITPSGDVIVPTSIPQEGAPPPTYVPAGTQTPQKAALPRTPRAGKKSFTKEFKEIQFKSFESTALKQLAKTHFEIDDDGQIATRKEKVPLIKTSPKAIKIATAKLDKEIASARAKGVGDREAEVARAAGARRIAKDNYVLDRKGDIKYRTIEIPKIKTSPRALKRDLARVRQLTHEIKVGKRNYFPRFEGSTKHTTILGDLAPTAFKLGKAAVMGPTGALIEEFVREKAAPKVGKELLEGIRHQQREQDMAYRSAGLDFIPEARTAAMKGIRTGVLVGTEYLTRPGLAIEAIIANELANPKNPISFLLDKRSRKKLAKSAGPLDVLLHGHGAKNAASGGDITEALFGLPQAGLAVDLATDPFMYIGFAGLPAKYAERTAALTARLAKDAPGSLKSVQFTRLMENAQRSGDYEAITDYLEGVAKKHGVSTRKLGKTKLDKAAIEEVNRATVERAREIADLIEAGRKRAPEVGGKSIHVPGEASQRAAEEVAKFGLRRSLKPGFTVELRTPLGRKLGGIEVPVPKSLADKKLFVRPAAMSSVLGREPESTKLLEMARSSKANADVYAKYADDHERLLNRVADLESNPTVSRTELRTARSELTKFEDNLRATMMDARTKALSGSKNLASMNELMRSYNAKRFAHEIYRTTNALGRQTQRVFFHNVMQAIKPVLHDRDARLRIGTHMALEADVGARAMLDEVAPLTTKEKKVVDDLRNIYKELETYGFETGTLRNAVENYIPRYWSSADDVGGPLHAGPRSEEILPLGGKRGAASAFQQHRTMAEMAAIADKQKLAQLIRRVATKPIDTKKSLDIAERWFRTSKIRLAMEDMAQAVQRGVILKEENLTDLQKAAYEWSGQMVSDSAAVPRLFQDLEATEGVLKLHPEAYKFHNFVEEPFTGLSSAKEYQVKLSSALEGRARIQEARAQVTDGSPLADHYDAILKQRDDEIAALKASKPAAQEAPDRAITPVHDGAEAPTQEMVGPATDREIEGFMPMPNATDEYIGTLKDFRRDHPDKFPVLDPMLSNYHRTRAEGLQTVYKARWRSIDSAVGRSTAEARASRYRLADGREGYTSDIKPIFGGEVHDKPIAYAFRETDERIDLADIEFPGRTLIPNREYKIWYDPVTGREYAEAPNLDAAVGGAIRDTIGPDRLWPTDVIRDARAEFFRMGETGMTDLYDSGIENLAQRTLTMIRYGVTTLFPAFHFRNMISDTLLSTLADPGFLFHPVANAKLTWSVLARGGKAKVNGVEFGVNHVKVPGLGKMKPEDYLGIMDTFGLRSNQHIAEMARLAERGDVAELEKWWQGVHSYRRPLQLAKGGFGLGPTGAVGRRAIEASARREDIMRIITFTQRMRRNKGDFADAMWWTIKHHFDYGDLTAFERRWMRNLFLFYTWYRKNIPLQFMSIITRPGFFSGMTNAYLDLAEGETPLNFNWSKINPILPDMSGPVPNSALVPDYMFTQLAAPSMNWNGHALAVGFGAPWADMNLIGHFMEDQGEGTRQFLAMFNPAVSLPFQYAFQTDLLTGRKFDKREASGPASMVNWLAEKFGFDPLQKDDLGNPVLPWQVNLAFNQLPIAGRLTGYFRGEPPTEDPGRVNRWFGGGFGTFLTGFNAYVSPAGGERLHAAYISRVIGRAAQRAALSQEGGTDADLAEFDQQTIQWAKQLGIPHKYLEVVPGIGPAYVTQEEREGFKLGSGGSPLTGSGGGQLKGLLQGEGGFGGLDFGGKDKEYGSQSQESLEKFMRPGQFDEPSTLSPLQGGILPSGEIIPSNTLASGAELADTEHLNAAMSRLRLNRAARTGKPIGPEQQKRVKDQPTRTQQPKPGRNLNPQHDSERAKASIADEFKRDRKKAKQRAAKIALKQLVKSYPELKLNNAAASIASASKKYDVPPDVLASIYKIESASGTNPGVSSAGAQGPMQFMPQTWAEHGVKRDGSKASPEEIQDTDAAMHSAAKYLKAAGWVTGDPDAEYDAIYAYNHADWYVTDVQDGRTEYQSGLWNEIGTKARSITKEWGGKRRGKILGDIGGVEDEALRMGRAIAGIARVGPLNVISGARPGSITTSGNVSNHSYGTALDIEAYDQTEGATPAEEARGDKIFKAAAIAVGVPKNDPQIQEVIDKGGMISFTDKFGREGEIIWKSDIGGNHHNHVHVGFNPTTGQGPNGSSATIGSGSYSGTGYGVGGATPASGGQGYDPEQAARRERSVEASRRRMAAAGSGGGSISSTLGTGAMLTVEEAYGLGGGAIRPGDDIVEALKRALEQSSRPPKAKTPKFNLKSSRL